ncbi:MAG: BrnA antitoxin family protein, partial [Deltaproteobacteria bacterium]
MTKTKSGDDIMVIVPRPARKGERVRRYFNPSKVGTRSERLARERMLNHIHALESDDQFLETIREKIPVAWRTLERDIDVSEPKVKVTMRIDESVIKFYRAMGTSYQERMNRILATFAQYRIGRAQELADMVFTEQKEMEREYAREMDVMGDAGLRPTKTLAKRLDALPEGESDAPNWDEDRWMTEQELKERLAQIAAEK